MIFILRITIVFVVLGMMHINKGELVSAFVDAMCVVFNIGGFFYFNLKDEIQKNK